MDFLCIDMGFIRMREEIHLPTSEVSPEAPLKVQSFGISYCDGSYRICRRGSSINVVEFVVEGSGTLVVNGESCHPASGDVYIVPAGSNHAYWSSSENPWTKIWFNVTGPLFGTLIESYSLGRVRVLHAPELEGVFRSHMDEAASSPENAHAIVALAVHRILIGLSSVARETLGWVADEGALRLKLHLDRNVKENLSLREMSRICGKSPSQTIRLFKREWGTTPGQYHLSRKLSAAQALLCSSCKPVKTIAAELGFDDQFHFSSIYKKKIGESPSATRSAGWPE